MSGRKGLSEQGAEALRRTHKERYNQ
jgi:hypothetical protein